jgi:predicted transcriptional regulator
MGSLRRYRVTTEGVEALRTSTSAMRRLSRGLDDLLAEEA